MNNLDISQYLDAVHQDWKDSQDDFPNNVYQKGYWPIPFFGNPRTAVVATVGVNPSSGEFTPERNWSDVRTLGDWKRRLKRYFVTSAQPPHRWFGPWRLGLDVLGMSYERSTAAHFDVSYRPTRAMLRNSKTDPAEFRRMVEQDVAWFFRLLPLCERLRVLLIYGPLVRADGSTESLAAFLHKQATRHGFTVLPDGGLRIAASGETGRSFFVHEVRTSGRGAITEQVVSNLRRNHDTLRDHIEAGRRGFGQPLE